MPFLKIFIFTIISGLFFLNTLSAKNIDYTLEDRDRIIRIETIIKEFKESTDRRFESIDNRFESIENRFESIENRFESIDNRFAELINIFIGIVAAFAGIVAVTIGFAVWDRRTTVMPLARENNNIIKKEEQIEHALKEFAKKEPAMKDVLRKVGIL